jgi:hypothetical protein
MRYLVVIAAVALTSCSDARNFSPTEARNIVLGCDALAERFPAVEDLSKYPSPSEWPPALSQLNPDEVRIDVLGVYVRLESHYVEEEGLYVPAPSVTKEPPGQEADPSYVRIGPRLYRYRIKG